MALKDRERLREIIGSIDVCDFDFNEVKTTGEIECDEINITDYIDTENKKMHKVTIPKVSVSMYSWYGEYESNAKYYNEKRSLIEHCCIGRYCFNMNDEAYIKLKSIIENVSYIETQGNVMYAVFSNNEKLNEIKRLKLFSSFVDRVYWGYPFKGWTGDVFAASRMEGPIYTERNKILNLVDCLSDYTEVDKEKLVSAYKSFLRKELKKLEEDN